MLELRVQQFEGFKDNTEDFGVDILATKGGNITAVQIKRYKGSVGVEAINQAVAGCGFYRADNSLVITNSYFTSAARKLAHSNNCELIDRDALAILILEFQRT